MPPFLQTVGGIYLEVAIYVIACIIITTILIIESIEWYLSGRTKQITTEVTHKVDIDMTITVSDHTNDTTANSGSVQPSNSTHKSNSSQKSGSIPSPTSTETVHSSSISHNSETPKVFPFIRILPISVYICYICGATATIAARLALGIHHHCDYIGIGGFFYMCSKCCLYLVLLYRLFKVYSGSIFQKSTRRLKMAAVFTVLWGLFLTVFNVITMRQVTVMIDGNIYCSSESHPFAILLLLIYDVTLNFGCCYAFTRPLLWLSKMKKRSSEVNGVYDAVVRYTVLTVVAVASTFLIMFAVVALKFNGLVLMDMALNSVCIMLFNKAYQRFYYCACCGAHYIGYKVIRMKCCCGRKEQDKNINN